MTIDNKTQYTLGNEPEIHWNYLLTPEHPYIVMITAVSYGYTTNFPTYGSKESTTFIKEITTKECKKCIFKYYDLRLEVCVNLCAFTP